MRQAAADVRPTSDRWFRDLAWDGCAHVGRLRSRGDRPSKRPKGLTSDLAVDAVASETKGLVLAAVGEGDPTGLSEPAIQQRVPVGAVQAQNVDSGFA